jgi:D-alanyl-D-alanine carboxypeptidase
VRTAAGGVVVLLLVGTLAVVVAAYRDRDGVRHPVAVVTPHPASSATSRHPAGNGGPTGLAIDLSAHSTTDPSSIWVVVDKTHPIRPLDFRPELAIVRGYQVAEPAAGPLSRLLDAGDAAGLGLKIESAFRSYGYQVAVHDSTVASRGQAAADRVSARPGYSEHQTGLAVDLITPADPRCDFDQCFASTPAGTWLRANAWRYGFVIRYTAGNEAVTGYSPEPWHLRYVGRPLAAAMRAAGVDTLEEVFGIAGGDYARTCATSRAGACRQ